MSLPERLQRRRDVRFRIVDREAVVLRQDAGETLVLNEVGSRILALLDEGEPLSALAGRLAEEFQVEDAEVEPDIDHFVRELLAAGVLEEREP